MPFQDKAGPLDGETPGKGGPTVYTAEFETKSIDWTELHTFFDTRDWGKGVLIINGFNVGRYWPMRGPQVYFFAFELNRFGRGQFFG